MSAWASSYKKNTNHWLSELPPSQRKIKLDRLKTIIAFNRRFLGTTQNYGKIQLYKVKQTSPVTGLEWRRGFQEVKVKQSRYRRGVAQRVPGS
jgi:hypothetical protein